MGLFENTDLKPGDHITFFNPHPDDPCQRHYGEVVAVLPQDPEVVLVNKRDGWSVTPILRERLARVSDDEERTLFMKKLSPLLRAGVALDNRLHRLKSGLEKLRV